MNHHQAMIAKEKKLEEHIEKQDPTNETLKNFSDQNNSIATIKKIRQELISKLRPAKAKDWQSFIDARSEDCTHFYDYNFERIDCFFVPRENIVLPPLPGSFSIYVIEPINGPSVSYGEGFTGCIIFRMRDPDNPELKWVPSYNNASKNII